MVEGCCVVFAGEVGKECEKPPLWPGETRDGQDKARVTAEEGGETGWGDREGGNIYSNCF